MGLGATSTSGSSLNEDSGQAVIGVPRNWLPGYDQWLGRHHSERWIRVGTTTMFGGIFLACLAYSLPWIFARSRVGSSISRTAFQIYGWGGVGLLACLCIGGLFAGYLVNRPDTKSKLPWAASYMLTMGGIIFGITVTVFTWARSQEISQSTQFVASVSSSVWVFLGGCALASVGASICWTPIGAIRADRINRAKEAQSS